MKLILIYNSKVIRNPLTVSTNLYISIQENTFASNKILFLYKDFFKIWKICIMHTFVCSRGDLALLFRLVLYSPFSSSWLQICGDGDPPASVSCELGLQVCTTPIPGLGGSILSQVHLLCSECQEECCMLWRF